MYTAQKTRQATEGGQREMAGMEAHLTDIFEMFYVNALCVHDLFDHIGSHLLPVLWVLFVCIWWDGLFRIWNALHAVTARIPLIHSNLDDNILLRLIPEDQTEGNHDKA